MIYLSQNSTGNAMRLEVCYLASMKLQCKLLHSGDGVDGADITQGLPGRSAWAQWAQRGAAQAPYHWR